MSTSHLTVNEPVAGPATVVLKVFPEHQPHY